MKITTKNLKKVIEEEVSSLLIEKESRDGISVPDSMEDRNELAYLLADNLHAGSSIEELVLVLQAMAKRVYDAE